MPASRNHTTFALLMLCSMLSLAGTDLILPAIPRLPELFSTTASTSQLVLAAYAGGSALGLLLFGHLAERIARRTLLLSSLGVFALASLACMFASGIDTLIALRALQGAASAAAPVFAPGIIRQLFDPQASVRAIGLLGSAESLSPALAPLAGAALLAHFGWRSSFGVLSVAAALAALLILRLGLPPQTAASTPRGTYRQLLGNVCYLRYALSQALTLGGLLTFVFGAPAVIVGAMGGSLDDFIILQIINVASFIVAANLAARLGERFGTERVIMAGSLMGLFSALTLLLYGLGGGSDPRWLPLLFLPMGVGLGLRGPAGFYLGVVASGENHARGSALIVFFILGITTLGTALAAPFIGLGLAALAVVASALHLLSTLLLWRLPALPGPAPAP
ncbi:hypothetical protein BBB39_08330 [Bordetella trematum]|uniref:Bicyclomycin resistance protein ( transporter) n=1 Tax=Bordetella trematum TaxID=123899 RepID=A0A157PZP2_9BORD|nr:MFS transporter [Bordetella trematum]AUL46973.1 hypothetical protein BTL55_08295 [Bordetella trematum]AZR93774.1 hypothetical protein BBB39_08330 [Bordetella trematum]NNH21013.1 MFS transporter [Bordetella trematum]QIM72354.1 MFS transporter [Bordetella trematum]SAH99460.1 bicyclomycin resistance protein (transporter) [Bordetella trematum]